jgi:hypothetical protein
MWLESLVVIASSCEEAQTRGADCGKEELDAGAKTVKELREAVKSWGRVQARKAAVFWHG